MTDVIAVRPAVVHIRENFLRTFIQSHRVATALAWLTLCLLLVVIL